MSLDPPAERPLSRRNDVCFEIDKTAASGMRVPARVFADETLLQQIRRDRSLDQLVNVTHLPGIYGAAMGMPDMHEGYGFPVGGVAATVLPDGVISPGGIGFDINCGVRLLASDMRRADLDGKTEPLIHELSRAIPAGMGRGHRQAVAAGELERVLTEGCRFLVREKGLGRSEDLDFIESGGAMPGADAQAVSDRAKERGADQLGTLGSGNHFLELQMVEEIHDRAAAAAFGLELEQLVVLIHSGSRGLGHQVCTDYVRLLDSVAGRYGIELPDRQLACAPLSSPEGTRYFAAMAAAANFGWCNRQVITHRIREVWRRILPGARGTDLRVLYDVAHNTAKKERYGARTLCVHRKGATRAFGPSSDELPAAYRGVGQPVLIPGSMGTASYVLVGTDAAAELSFSSSCHGAGRAMSRGAAKRAITGAQLRQELGSRGIVVRCPSNSELAEEAPLAYKDVDRVVTVVERAGLARRVVRLRPLGVVKG
jgi:tRNA-splicing ligase RtcB (3'-phosphate/5'-hydroxy nucleic acid ligase)